LFDSPSFGKSISLLQKCDVAPESMINRFSILLGSLLSHLFGLGISFIGILYVMFASSSSFSSSYVSFD
jgi:hypothetical protein